MGRGEKAPRATLDFETRSQVDLRRHGTWRYATSPTTEIMVAAFRLPHWAVGRTEIWHPEYPELGLLQQGGNFDALMEFFDWITSGGLVEAHNAWFERNIWRHISMPRYGWPDIALTQWRCSAAQAAAVSLPRGLDDALAAMQLALRKDASGAKVMMKMTKPRKPRKAEREAWAEQFGDMPMGVLYHENRHLLDQLFDYVRQDVLAEEGLSYVIPDLSPDELEMYWLDQELNDRGFQIDLEAVDAALYLLQEEAADLNAELVALTGGTVAKATQRKQLTEWLAGQGLVLENTQAATLDELLDIPDWRADGRTLEASDAAHRALQILRTLGRSSTSKYEAMRKFADLADGRVRGGLLYHGATTGRWTGAGVQPHNFPKGVLKGPKDAPKTEALDAFNVDVEALWDDLKLLDRPAIRAKYDASVLACLSHGLRSAIVAAPGHELFVADYASIEARVVLWLAGDEDALEVFRSGKDIYLYTAEAIYKRPITKADIKERQMGKQACLGADTMVLTDSGWLPITEVTVGHSVWDGQQWASHGGVVCNGMRETISLDGVVLTPDHRILTGGTWRPALEVAQSVYMLNRALATGLENSQLLVSCAANEGGSEKSGCDARVVPSLTWWQRTTFATANLRGAISALWQKLRQRESSDTGDTLIYCRKWRIERDYSTALVRSLRAARTRRASNTTTTEGGVFASISRGWQAIKRATGIRRAWGGGSFSSTCLRWTGGISPNWNWTAPTTTKATDPAISVSLLEALTRVTNDRCATCRTTSPNCKPVYDIVSAGPLQRFLIKTNSGVMLAHNCLGLGFQMGAPKFVDTVAKYGISIVEDNWCDICGEAAKSHKRANHAFTCAEPADITAVAVVEAYREKYWRTKQLWSDQEAAAITAVQTKREVEAGLVTWCVEGAFLYAELPSGRRLAYPFPKVSMQETSWGSEKLTLSFMTVNPKTRQWVRQKTYGGMIVENVTQAVARDLIASAMLRLSRTAIYKPVLSVHDEAIAEAIIGTGSVKGFEQLVAELPEWADGLPVAAEAWKGLRYRK